jgi:acyl-CoA thioesterase
MKGNDHFRELLGITVVEVRDGYAKTSLKVTKEHTNIHGFTHGGVIFALADCAFAEASNFGATQAVAIQVSINYMKPSSDGDDLVAEATRVAEGKTFSVFNIAVSKENKLIALFTGLAYKIPSGKP